MGAGLFVGGDGLMAAFNQVTPAYQTALERRVGASTWLALNARFSFDSFERLTDPTSTNPTPTATTRIDRTNVMGLLGVRQIFVHGVVEVSGYSAILAGYHDASGDELGAASLLVGAGDGYDLGLLVGLAAERELLEALSLRLGFDLVSATISSDEAAQQDDVGNRKSTQLGSGHATLSIQPSLQLHLYF